ncbi:DUF6376 family protein [Bacillus timonensis]|uniref:DUF6376 family protein n=1 Tax=Bacillus timonensis TaxID=1033734 RepID=UPI0002894B85|nr:DUF6376 family protein [Bacillus timonensis]
MNDYHVKKKEKEYNSTKSSWTKGRIEDELEREGYKRQPGFGKWVFEKNEENNEKTSEPLPVHPERLTPPILLIIVIVATLLLNPYLSIIYALLVPFFLLIFIKDKILKDILSLLPLYIFLGIWILAMFPFRFIPGFVKKIYNIHYFSLFYSGIVLFLGLIQYNELRIENNRGFFEGIFSYKWLSLLNFDQKALFWSVPIYLVFMLVIRFLDKRSAKEIIQSEKESSKLSWRKILIAILLIIPLLVALKNWEPIENIFVGNNFVDQTVTHINNLKELEKKLPLLAKEAEKDQASLQELEETLRVLKTDLIRFNEQKSSPLLGDLPDEFKRRNNLINSELDNYIVQVNNNNPGLLEQTKLLQSIHYLTDMLDENNDIKKNWKENK